MKKTAAAGIAICISFFPLLSRAQEIREPNVSKNPAGAQAGAFSASSRKDSLGSVQIGSAKTDSLTVTNTGSTTLTISSVISTGIQFTVGPASASLPAGTARKFGLTFTPTTTGAQTSSIVFAHDGPSSPDTVFASGTGTAPAFSVNRRAIAYGFVVIATGRRDSVIVTNTGTAALVISSVTSSNGRFVVAPTSATIEPGTQSTFRITFTPTSSSVQNANIVFRHNAPTARDTVAVSGTGTAFSINRRSIAFGTVQVDGASKDSVVVTNAGGTALTVSGVTSTNGSFSISPASASIAAAGSAKFYVTFTPAGTTAQTGNIVFTHSASSSHDTVTVSGTGALPGFTLNRKTVGFGFVTLGGYRPDSVTVTDTGNAPLVISNVTSNNGTFVVKPTTATVQPGYAQTFSITFTPSNTSPQSGSIVFTHNAPGGHDTLSVSGTGGVAGFSVTRRSVAFGVVVVGSSRVDSVAVTNTGTVPLVISGVASSNGTFTVTPGNATLQPAQTRTYYVTFTPASVTAQSGNIVFTHNAPGGYDTLTVTGTGGVAGFSANRKSVAFGTLPVGTTAKDSVVVTNLGTATLTVFSVVSTNGSFSVIPGSASIAAAGSAKFYVTFSPVNTAAQTGNIVFTHSAWTSHDTVAVSGSGGVAGFSVTRRFVSFGVVSVGTSRLDSVTVTDTGAVPLVISSAASGNGAFTVNPPNAVIQPAQSRKFYFTFTPSGTIQQSGIVVFTHNALSVHDTIAVSGTGGAAGFSMNRNSIPFGTVQVGTTSKDSVVVTNSGTTSLTVSSAVSTNDVFSVSPASASIAAAGSATFYITFSPANTAAQAGAIVFTHSASSLHDTVDVSGTGGLAGFSVTRRSVPFGVVGVGSSRLDSVTVIDTGTVALVVSSVTSSNGTFTVNPSNAAIQPAKSSKFYFTFTPSGTSQQSGLVVFSHNGPSLHDTIVVSGTGGVSGFLVNRKSVAFGGVVVGNAKADSIAVTDTGEAPLVIHSVTVSNGRFGVNPPNATIQPGATRTFILLFTPLDTNPQTGTLVFSHNAPGLRDTVTLGGTGVAPLPPPLLQAPPNGSAGEILPVALGWSTVAGATGYRLEMATDPAFANVVLNDSTLVSPARQVDGLPQNTQYFWRVSTRSAAGTGPFSSAWTLTTFSSGSVAGTVSFSGDVSSASYRMFGLPGVGTRKVGDILSGTPKLDWRILCDTGRDTTYPAYYEDLTADSVLIAGEGYWLLQKKDLTISRTDTLPPLATDGTYSIPLHRGWNMISNPFTVAVQRAAIIAANGLPGTTVFWEHAGATRTDSGTTLDPFKGYYFDNDTSNITKLKIPFPFGTAAGTLGKAAAVDWRAELVFTGAVNTDRGNYIGIAPSVKQGRNEMDRHEAPLVFDQGFLYFDRPAWDAVHTRFATDIRPALGAGQTWDFEVWNPRNGTGKITLLGLEGIPPQEQVVLVNILNSSPVDMRRANVYTYQTSSTKMRFKLIVGSAQYVDDETSKLVPKKCELAQNYPNPFNPSTTISYTLPASSNVRLEVFSVIGQRVRILDEGFRAPATYSLIWDGRDDKGESVSSGVYFCRLIAGGNAVMTRKLILLK